MAQHVGGSNLAAGLKDAYLACSPVIALTGGPAPMARYRHAYQELEDFNQFEHTTKFNAHVDHIARSPTLLRTGVPRSNARAPGPVHLQIGGHHAESVMTEADLELIVEERYKQVPPLRPLRIQGKSSRRCACSMPPSVRSSSREVAWRGPARRRKWSRLRRSCQIPVATSLNAKGTILDTHPLAVGVTGTYSRACANRTVGESDLVFYIGSHTGGQVTTRWQVPRPGKPVVHLDIDAREIGRNYPTNCGLVGDAKTVLKQMLDAAGRRVRQSAHRGSGTPQGFVAEWRALRLRPRSIPMPCRCARNAYAARSRAVLPERAVLVCDTGHSGIWSGTMIDFTRPGQRLIRCADRLAGVFPARWRKMRAAGYAGCVLRRRRRVLLHLAELETAGALRHQLGSGGQQ